MLPAVHAASITGFVNPSDQKKRSATSQRFIVKAVALFLGRMCACACARAYILSLTINESNPRNVGVYA